MIAVDTNLLVYAHRRDALLHVEAASAIAELARSGAPWAIPWPCLHEFFAIVTHPRIYRPPSTVEQATTQIEVWLEAPALVLLSETPVYWPVLKDTVTVARVTGPLVHDARIAALCLSAGVRELWSSDRDFSRFPRLAVRNPLV